MNYYLYDSVKGITHNFPSLGDGDYNTSLDEFSVYRSESLPLSVGEKIKVTEQIRFTGGFVLDKGAELWVSGIGKEGLKVQDINGSQYTMPTGFGYFDHDYYSTSYSSQSKTVDKVIVSQSNQSLGASNAKQTYVSMSRGSKDISVYTDDKDMLLQMAGRIPDEMSGVEMVAMAKEEARAGVLDREVNDGDRDLDVEKEVVVEDGKSVKTVQDLEDDVNLDV